MLFTVKILLLIASIFLLISSILVLFFKKDYLVINYKEGLKEGLISHNYTKWIGLLTMLYSIAYIVVISLSIGFKMETDEFIVAFLFVTMLFMLSMAATMLIRSMKIKKTNDKVDDEE
jgi:hypothetical protein